MPNPSVILCPHCGESISFDEALTTQLQEKIRQEVSAASNAQTARKIKEAEEAARREAAATFAAEQEAAQKKLQLLEADAASKDQKLREMTAQELRLRQEKNQLEERERQLALEVQRQVDEEKHKLRDSIAKEVTEQEQFKLAQRDKIIDDLKKQLSDAQRVAHQGSQQSQGEVVELELEHTLQRLFPLDTISPVGKGMNGADIIQTVCDRSGNRCGTVVWELKNTKAWSPGWIAKLKEDQRREKAEVAVIISTVLPEGIKEFGNVDGIWVGTLSCVTGLATVLRSSLLELASARSQGENKQEKMEVLYTYLTGVAFNQRVQSVVEAFVEMQTDLLKEKRAFARIWESREKQLERAVLGMSGMWGDLEGLMGPALPRMEALSLEDGSSTEP